MTLKISFPPLPLPPLRIRFVLLRGLECRRVCSHRCSHLSLARLRLPLSLSQSLALARIDFSDHSLFSLVNPLLCRGYYTEYQ